MENKYSKKSVFSSSTIYGITVKEAQLRSFSFLFQALIDELSNTMKPGNRTIFQQLITGSYETLPKEKPKKVRIFFSSTFTGKSVSAKLFVPKIYP